MEKLESSSLGAVVVVTLLAVIARSLEFVMVDLLFFSTGKVGRSFASRMLFLLKPKEKVLPAFFSSAVLEE